MTTPTEFEVAGVRYQSTKLNAFHQLHVLRKLGPVLAKIGPGFLTVPPSIKTNDDGTTTAVPTNPFADLASLGPALEALSEMSELDCEYIIHRCLAVTKRFQPPNGWAPIWNDTARRLQYEDTDLSTMMQITMHVLGDSLTGFSQGGGLNFGVPSSVQSAPSNSSPLPTMRIS